MLFMWHKFLHDTKGTEAFAGGEGAGAMMAVQ